MNRFNLQAALLLSLLMMGCAGTALNVQTAYTPTADSKISYTVDSNVEITEQGLAIFRERLDSQLSASGLLASGSTGPGRTVEISITNYYMRHGATRALVGVMAGADNMQSSIIVRDASSKAVVGQFSVESTNPTAMGTSQGMIQDHADKIVQYLKTGGG